MKTKHRSHIPENRAGGPSHPVAPLALVLFSLSVLASCTTVPKDSATLVLTVEDPYGVKTLVPDIDMKPAGYDFSGSGPNGDSFTAPNGKIPRIGALVESG